VLPLIADNARMRTARPPVIPACILFVHLLLAAVEHNGIRDFSDRQM